MVRPGTVLPLSTSTILYGGTDKAVHGYTPVYGRMFRRFRFRKIGILEIGVGGYARETPGGSLRIWRDHFPRATIVGLDLHAKSVRLGRRVRFVQGDQSKSEDLLRAVEALSRAPLTIVIDDGSHQAGHARASFDVLFPLLSSGGLYAVEDLHTSYWEKFGGSIPAEETTAVGLARMLVDETQVNDEVFARRPAWGPKPDSKFNEEVAELHVFPGLVIAKKK